MNIIFYLSFREVLFHVLVIFIVDFSPSKYDWQIELEGINFQNFRPIIMFKFVTLTFSTSTSYSTCLTEAKLIVQKILVI